MVAALSPASSQQALGFVVIGEPAEPPAPVERTTDGLGAGIRPEHEPEIPADHIERLIASCRRELRRLTAQDYGANVRRVALCEQITALRNFQRYGSAVEPTKRSAVEQFQMEAA